MINFMIKNFKYKFEGKFKYMIFYLISFKNIDLFYNNDNQDFYDKFYD